MPKIKHYVWRLATNRVAVKDNLIRRRMQIDPGCPVCGDNETREHMATGCKWTEHVWRDMTGTRTSDSATVCKERWLDEQRRA